MQLISLVLYGRENRYWLTLPAAIVAYLELYPGFAIRLHHPPEVKDHMLWQAILHFAQAEPRLQLSEVTRAHANYQASMWRLLPLWDPKVSVVLCRDVDSVPDSDELSATRLFLKHPTAAIHSLRSYMLHGTLLMAGLCGFKPPLLKSHLEKTADFDQFLHNYSRGSKSNGTFGCDQDLLSAAFSRVAGKILDTPVNNAGFLGEPLIQTSQAEIYGQSLADLDSAVIQNCNREMHAEWIPGQRGFAGRPSGDFRRLFHNLVKHGCKHAVQFNECVHKSGSSAVEYLKP